MQIVVATLTAVAIAVAACATTEEAPREYQQGAYRPPPPAPVFSPTTDAPHTTGHPGHFAPPRADVHPNPRLPPVPHTPKTRSEDTIWASGGTKGEKTPTLFRIPLPLPEEAPTPKDRDVAGYCGASMEIAASWAGKFINADALHSTPRTCLAAMLYAFCMNKRQDHKWVVEDAARRHPPVRAAANAFESKACTKELREALQPVADAISATWNTYALESGRMP
jgi:hypothetical protein